MKEIYTKIQSFGKFYELGFWAAFVMWLFNPGEFLVKYNNMVIYQIERDRRWK